MVFDRLLKGMGRMKAEEGDVMKNVPYWEVGEALLNIYIKIRSH